MLLLEPFYFVLVFSQILVIIPGFLLLKLYKETKLTDILLYSIWLLHTFINGVFELIRTLIYDETIEYSEFWENAFRVKFLLLYTSPIIITYIGSRFRYKTSTANKIFVAFLVFYTVIFYFYISLWYFTPPKLINKPTIQDYFTHLTYFKTVSHGILIFLLSPVTSWLITGLFFTFAMFTSSFTALTPHAKKGVKFWRFIAILQLIHALIFTIANLGYFDENYHDVIMTIMMLNLPATLFIGYILYRYPETFIITEFQIKRALFIYRDINKSAEVTEKESDKLIQLSKYLENAKQFMASMTAESSFS